MGKSTTAALFAAQSVPVYSADVAVHSLYQKQDVIAQIAAAFPEAITTHEHPAIDRSALSCYLVENPIAIKKLEMIVHPLLHECESAFLQQARQEHQPLVVLDIPLLYETGAESRVDYVAVVSASFPIQRQRVLARQGMSEEKFNLFLARQIPDSEKRKRADFVINTGEGIETTQKEVQALIKRLMDKT